MAEDGETNEETLLQESATKEAYYMGRILELQSELKQSRAAASNSEADTEHLSSLLQELREVRYHGTVQSPSSHEPKLYLCQDGGRIAFG